MKVQYQIGTKSMTKQMDIDCLDVVQKQLEISTPMITSAHIQEEDGTTRIIYVGKKIDLHPSTTSQMYFTEKYDLSLEELIDIYLQGYTSVCLLNYKKYDQIVVPMNEYDEVVPDYYALREKIKEYCK